jgi:hypothetical protein
MGGYEPSSLYVNWDMVLIAAVISFLLGVWIARK